MTHFEMFERNIEPQKDHNMKDWQAGRKLELKHKNGMSFCMRIKVSLIFQLSAVIQQYTSNIRGLKQKPFYLFTVLWIDFFFHSLVQTCTGMAQLPHAGWPTQVGSHTGILIHTVLFFIISRLLPLDVAFPTGISMWLSAGQPDFLRVSSGLLRV